MFINAIADKYEILQTTVVIMTQPSCGLISKIDD